MDKIIARVKTSPDAAQPSEVKPVIAIPNKAMLGKFQENARQVLLRNMAKRFMVSYEFMDDLDTVKYLVSKGANVNHRTTKNLFEKEASSSSPITTSKSSSKYKAFGYYGEYPLSIAAVFNHTQIYDFLIQSDADTDAQDSFGNTVLHVIVTHNQIDMFSYAMRHPWKRANPWTTNNDNLTPIALCVQLGYAEMFNEIMELSRVEVKKYSDLEESLYPMASFDSIGPNGVTDHQSAIMLLVDGEESGHLEMLHHDVVRNILEAKWRVFVKKRFKGRLILTVLHTLFVTLAVYLRPAGRAIGYVDWRDAVRYLSESVICFLGTPLTVMFHIEEIKTSGLALFLRGLKNAPSKAVFLVSCLLLAIAVNIRFAQFIHPHKDHTKLVNAEEACLVIIAPASWLWFLFFLKTHNSFGPLIITLYTMIAKDVTKVMIIFSVFWFMFAVVFLYLWKDTVVDSLDSIEESVMNVFHMSFGTFEYKYFNESKFPVLAAICFLLMMMLMPILLLNMLIATMGKNRGYLQDMSSDWICAGLPVTKRVAHTKAFVHKRCYKNWKWIYKLLRTLIKAKRTQIKEDRRVTYYDLFGNDDILDSEYLREKMVADNLRNISLNHLFKRSFEQDNLLTVAQQALSAKVPETNADSKKASENDSLDDLLRDVV
ncbi:transient receptor potential cation channel subfamily V member 3-like [Watersipora subatra]|uniref:transient receptor potential cation channel subfamily V member 3-like n=1 Tax=Watersipora subatra TaxID=2589382 RepID=UPI00355B031E